MVKTLSAKTFLIAILLAPIASFGQDFIWDGGSQASALTLLNAASGLKVFWWNVHAERANEAQPDPDCDRNLAVLLHTEGLAPDLLTFGEFTESGLSAATLRLLQQHYPHSVRLPYPASPSESIAVFSRWPIAIQNTTTLTDGSAGDMRPLMILNINVQGKNLRVIPVHIADAWREYMSQNGEVKTAVEILTGTTGPVAQEINQTVASIHGQTGDTILLGDFNQPSTLFDVPTREYQTLANGWRNAVANVRATFPATDSIEAQTFPAMDLDHALISPNLSAVASATLPLRGSDHYPLYVVVGGF